MLGFVCTRFIPYSCTGDDGWAEYACCYKCYYYTNVSTQSVLDVDDVTSASAAPLAAAAAELASNSKCDLMLAVDWRGEGPGDGSWTEMCGVSRGAAPANHKRVKNNASLNCIIHNKMYIHCQGNEARSQTPADY